MHKLLGARQRMQNYLLAGESNHIDKLDGVGYDQIDPWMLTENQPYFRSGKAYDFNLGITDGVR